MKKHEQLDRGCRKCLAPRTEMRIGRATTLSGAEVFPWFCRKCNRVTTYYERREAALAITRKNGWTLPWVETNSVRRGVSNPPCERCGAQGTELHHWAPSALFGGEADDWPTSYLCVTCHARWHQVVTPNLGQRA